MDKKELDKQQQHYNELFIKDLNRRIHFVNPRKIPNFSKTKEGNIGDILTQRHKQRKKLFWFSLAFVTITTLFVLIIIGLQAYINFHGYDVSLIGAGTLQIIVTGIFVQFVGLVGIITKSIWDDKPYLEAGVIVEKIK